MKKSLVLGIGILLFAVLGFNSCSSDDGGSKSSSNMTPVVKVETRGSVKGSAVKNNVKQKDAVDEDKGYYTLAEDKDPETPSSNVYGRSAARSSSSTGGTWTFIDTTGSSKFVKYAGTYTGSIEDANISMTVTSTVNEDGILVAVVQPKTFTFATTTSGGNTTFTAEIPEVKYDPTSSALSYAALRLPQPAGIDLLAGTTFENDIVIWNNAADGTTGNLTETFDFTDNMPVISVTHSYVVQKAAEGEGAEPEIISSQQYSYLAYYSYNSLTKKFYLKLKEIVSIIVDEETILENCPTDAELEAKMQAYKDADPTGGETVIEKYGYKIPDFVGLMAEKEFRATPDREGNYNINIINSWKERIADVFTLREVPVGEEITYEPTGEQNSMTFEWLAELINNDTILFVYSDNEYTNQVTPDDLEGLEDHAMLYAVYN